MAQETKGSDGVVAAYETNRTSEIQIQTSANQIQQRENDLVAATFGRGFYVLDDYAPLREIDDSVLSLDGALFPVKQAFTYALALERGANPCTVVADVPTEFATPTGTYAPNNYNHRFYGPVSLRFALGNSLNVAAIRVLNLAGGPEALHRRLGELGFIPGEPVQLLRRGPGGREPLAVQVGVTVFALRLLEARCIEVKAD